MTRTLRLVTYLAFVGLGLAQAIVGPLLPSIRDEVPMSDLEAGTLGSGQFIGILVAGLVGGYLADRFGKKAFLLVSSVLLALGLLGYTSPGAYGLLLLASIVAGLGCGGYEVGGNALQADNAEAGGSGHGMSLLHSFYCVGAVSGPFAVDLALRQRIGWRPAMWLAASIPAVAAVLLASRSVPRSRPAPVEERAAGLYRRPLLWLCGLVLLVYVGVEMSMNVWITTYWARRAPESAIPAPLMTSVFWGTYFVVRLVSGRLADRVGHLRYLALAAGTVAVVGTLWWFFSGPAFTLAAVIAIGVALAGVFPTAMAFATDAFPGQSGRAVGFLSVFVALGGFLLPAGLGRLSDVYDIGVLPLVVVGTSLALLAVVLSIRGQRPPPRITPATP